MNFDAIKEIINSPTISSVVSITLSAIYVIVIISKTSIGRKALKAMKATYEQITASCNAQIESFDGFKKTKEAEINEMREQYEERLALAVSECLAIESLLGEIAETTPNKKIKETIASFLSKKEERLSEMRSKIASYQDFEALKEELASARAETDKAIEEIKERGNALIEAKLAEIDKFLEESKKKAEEAEITQKEGNDEESEERTDANATEEAV